MTTVIEQTPVENLDWEIDWATRGLGTDTISTSTFSRSSDDFTISGATNTATTTTFNLSGGIPGTNYFITNTVLTAGGRTLTETAAYICLAKRII